MNVAHNVEYSCSAHASTCSFLLESYTPHSKTGLVTLVSIFGESACGIHTLNRNPSCGWNIKSAYGCEVLLCFQIMRS